MLSTHSVHLLREILVKIDELDELTQELPTERRVGVWRTDIAGVRRGVLLELNRLERELLLDTERRLTMRAIVPAGSGMLPVSETDTRDNSGGEWQCLTCETWNSDNWIACQNGCGPRPTSTVSEGSLTPSANPAGN